MQMRCNPRQRLQYQVNYDLLLDLDLLSPSPVKGHQLLLRAETIVEDALDVLLSAEQSQPLDSFGTGFFSGFIGGASEFGLQCCLIACERGHVGPGQLLRLRNQFFSVAERSPRR